MPPRPHRPSALAWQVFRGSDAIRRGLLTRHQLRGASWVRLCHDVYADARLDRDHALACRGAALRLPPGAVIAGPSAAYLHGVEHAAGFGDEVHVLTPPAVRIDSQRGIRVHSTGATGQPAERLDGSYGTKGRDGKDGTKGRDRTTGRDGKDGTTGRDGTTNREGTDGRQGRDGRDGRPPAPGPPMSIPALAVRTPPRSSPALAAWETAAWLDQVRAVGIVDSLLGSGLTSRAALAEVAERHADRPGGRRARRVFDLADPAAQSPPESHLRVRLVLAGLPRPVAQHPVRLSSGLLLHPDLAWPQFRVAVEYDGHWHADPDQLHRDRRRLNQLVAAGWVVLHVTSRRLRDDFPAVLREVRAALAERGWRR
ncbi:hypothetical protein [Micromonospora sp. NPDC092111]|uniref:hypothetical protein n=1 Tax=Micromonospora sp. NPDC092111 TaxID=3364289 RepID=UPI00382FC23A